MLLRMGCGWSVRYLEGQLIRILIHESRRALMNYMCRGAACDILAVLICLFHMTRV
jgi:hypothetical protein